MQQILSIYCLLNSTTCITFLLWAELASFVYSTPKRIVVFKMIYAQGIKFSWPTKLCPVSGWHAVFYVMYFPFSLVFSTHLQFTFKTETYLNGLSILGYFHHQPLMAKLYSPMPCAQWSRDFFLSAIESNRLVKISYTCKAANIFRGNVA